MFLFKDSIANRNPFVNRKSRKEKSLRLLAYMDS